VTLWVVVAAAAGLAAGAVIFWQVQVRGWYTPSHVAASSREQLALLAEGLRVVRGQSTAPCPACGFGVARSRGSSSEATAVSGRGEVRT
jgi:hypothetical protein